MTIVVATRASSSGGQDYAAALSCFFTKMSVVSSFHGRIAFDCHPATANCFVASTVPYAAEPRVEAERYGGRSGTTVRVRAGVEQ